MSTYEERQAARAGSADSALAWAIRNTIRVDADTSEREDELRLGMARELISWLLELGYDVVRKDELDYQIYVPDEAISCNDTDCPCVGKPLKLPRRTTPRGITAAILEHRLSRDV